MEDNQVVVPETRGIRLIKRVAERPRIESEESSVSSDEEDKDDFDDIPFKQEIRSKYFKVGWTLHKGVYFYSDKALPWPTTFEKTEEASATTTFVRCLGDKYVDSFNAHFFKNCLIWQYPNFPGLPAFPQQIRTRDRTEILSAYCNRQFVNEVHDQWVVSLQSLYKMLITDKFPFFYVVGRSPTILFRATGVCGFPTPHALITPTTMALRESLTKSGIKFSMPLRPDDESSDDDVDEILDSIGLTRQTAAEYNIKTYRNPPKRSDDTWFSLISIEGEDLPGLVDYITNNKSWYEPGFAPIPPTLLASTAFLGGSLKKLQVDESFFRIDENRVCFNFDVVGPIFPTALLQILQQLKSRRKFYQFELDSHDCTAAFSYVKSTKWQIRLDRDRFINFGMSKKLCEAICNEVKKDKKKILPPNTIVHCSDNIYTWR